MFAVSFEMMLFGFAAILYLSIAARPERRYISKIKQRVVIRPPLPDHTPAFSSRQTVTGKLMTFLSATEHAHGHHTHAHLAHHHGNGTLHVSFPP